MPPDEPQDKPDILEAGPDGSAPAVDVLPETYAEEQVAIAPAADPDPSRALGEYQIAKFQNDLDSLKQDLAEKRGLHTIRTWHAWLLFGLTVCWVMVIWIVVLLQGFGQWFFTVPGPDLQNGQFYLRFKLSDTVIVAFMTSTTATVLGLYGIAAYWLYGKRRPDGAKSNGAKKEKKKVAEKSLEESDED